MKTLNCIIHNKVSNINEFVCEEAYYDAYWQMVLDYPLIILPKNKIIFWGFDVTLSKNEYDLLKTIINLNTNNFCEQGYTEEQLVENIDYRQRNCKIDKSVARQHFISTSISRIKKQILNSVVDACINMIELHQYNPFIKGKEENKQNFTQIDSIKDDKKFKKQVASANINLVKIFPHMSNLTCMYDKYYSSFVFKNAFPFLISINKTRQNKSSHKLFKTNFIFSDKKLERNYKLNPRIRTKDDYFYYAKITPPKYNIYNFVNYPQYKCEP